MNKKNSLLAKSVCWSSVSSVVGASVSARGNPIPELWLHWATGKCNYIYLTMLTIWVIFQPDSPACWFIIIGVILGIIPLFCASFSPCQTQTACLDSSAALCVCVWALHWTVTNNTLTYTRAHTPRPSRCGGAYGTKLIGLQIWWNQWQAALHTEKEACVWLHF